VGLAGIGGVDETACGATVQSRHAGQPGTESAFPWRALRIDALKVWAVAELDVPAGEKGHMLIEQVSTRPTCDVNGIVGGYTGEGAKTVIAAQASAKISFRLVGTQDPEKIRDSFRAFVRKKLPSDAKAEFINHACSPALQVAYENPALAKARAALTEEWGTKAVAVSLSASGSVTR